MQGRGAGQLFEDLGKIALVFKAYHQGDVGQADILVAQQLFAVLNPHAVQIGAEGDAGFLFKYTAEI